MSLPTGTIIWCSWPFSLLETHRSSFSPNSGEGKQKWLLHRVAAPKEETIPTWFHFPTSSRSNRQREACSLLSPLFLVAPDIFQANNIPVQPWKCTFPSPPVKFVLVNKTRFLHTRQTPTTEKDGAEDRGTLGTDPVTGKWDGRGRDASHCATFWPHWWGCPGDVQWLLREQP